MRPIIRYFCVAETVRNQLACDTIPTIRRQSKECEIHSSKIELWLLGVGAAVKTRHAAYANVQRSESVHAAVRTKIDFTFVDDLCAKSHCMRDEESKFQSELGVSHSQNTQLSTFKHWRTNACN